ncbi:hypothetical protein ACJRO7_027488 [Eucalyptus globulus]|uniref:Uncharacterized protein n=1 Tax=Eucalyptus globulus TaxID=34317 RepID=A0ABD3K403_EUCGL
MTGGLNPRPEEAGQNGRSGRKSNSEHGEWRPKQRDEPRQTYRMMESDGNAGAGGGVRNSESREQAQLNTRSANRETTPPLKWRDTLRQPYAGAGGDVRSSESREQAQMNTRSATPENAPPLK